MSTADKTITDLAAEVNPVPEQPDPHPTTTPTTTDTIEAPPAITLAELEDLYLPGDVPEAAPRRVFSIADDGCADWAIRKIFEERKELDRITSLGRQQVAEIEARIAKEDRRYHQNTDFLTSCLAQYFNAVPHKKTKTTEKYRLLSGTLTLKLGAPKMTPDDAKLVPWLKAAGLNDMIKTEEKATWGELKKKLSVAGTVAAYAETGEIVEGVTVLLSPDVFTVDA